MPPAYLGGGIKGDGPPQTTLQKKYKTSKNKCNLDIFGSYCGTVLQYSIRGSGGGGGGRLKITMKCRHLN